MDIKKLFDKYYSRLAREGMLKALFSGLTIGFAVTTIVALICWYQGVSGGLIWSILTLVAVTGATVPLLYDKKFRPSVKQVAERLDRLGLKERMITMTEYYQDESLIARMQREDAQTSLHAMNTNRIRFVFSKFMLAALAMTVVFGTVSMTLSGLVAAGVINPGKDVIDNWLPEDPANYIRIQYVVGSGEGLIEGDDDQFIEIGENCEGVLAVADDGYAFVEWSDGSKNPARSDTELTESVIFEAVFAPIGDGDGDGDGEGEGEGDPGSGDRPGRDPNPSEEDGEPQGGANGAYEQNNLILDGTKPYYDYLVNDTEPGSEVTRYEEVLKWLETAEDIPDELREFIQTYFDILV